MSCAHCQHKIHHAAQGNARGDAAMIAMGYTECALRTVGHWVLIQSGCHQFKDALAKKD